jgi:hypothetical protein
MAFQVYRIVPRFDFRDSVVGNQAFVLPALYASGEAAAGFASRAADDGDDAYYVAVPVGASPFDQAAQVRPAAAALDCDIPF